jgi:hypothetical protein
MIKKLKKKFRFIWDFVMIIVNFIKRLGIIFFVCLGVEVYSLYRIFNYFDIIYIIFLCLLTEYVIELLKIRLYREEED